MILYKIWPMYRIYLYVLETSGILIFFEGIYCNVVFFVKFYFIQFHYYFVILLFIEHIASTCFNTGLFICEFSYYSGYNRIQAENFCIEDIPRLSIEPYISEKDEVSIVD